MVAHLKLLISHEKKTQSVWGGGGKREVVSLLLLLLLIFSHTEDSGLLAVIKMGCFSAVVDSFYFIGKVN